MEDSKGEREEPLLLSEKSVEPLVYGIDKERTYKDENGEITFHERPDDYVRFLLPRLKKRFDLREKKKGTFFESLPDDDLSRDLAICWRLAASERPRFQDPEFVKVIKNYIEKSPMGDEFGFRLAYHMFVSVYETIDGTWREEYESMEDIEVIQILIDFPHEEALKRVDKKYIDDEGRSISVPQGEETDPWGIGEMGEDDKKYFVNLIVKRVKRGNLNDDEYSKLQSLFGRTHPEWTDTNITRKDLEPLDDVLTDDDWRKMDEIQGGIIQRIIDAWNARGDA